MTWNYRVIRNHRTDAPTEVDCYDLVEAYYDDAGNVEGWCEATPSGETVDELRADLELMLRALDAPVIDDHDLPATFPPQRRGGDG